MIRVATKVAVKKVKAADAATVHVVNVVRNLQEIMIEDLATKVVLVRAGTKALKLMMEIAVHVVMTVATKEILVVKIDKTGHAVKRAKITDRI